MFSLIFPVSEFSSTSQRNTFVSPLCANYSYRFAGDCLYILIVDDLLLDYLVPYCWYEF